MDEVAGVILAGGLARRMGGGDKSLKMLDGITLLERVVARISPQVSSLVLNANGDPDRFKELEIPVAADVIADNPGPLAGVLTGLEWVAAYNPEIKWMISVPCDAPFIPMDLVERLMQSAQENAKPLACAMSHDRTHPVVGLWSVDLKENLRKALVDEELRKVDKWTACHGVCHVEFEDELIAGKTIDPFFNANKPYDLEEIEDYLAR